MVLLQGTLAVIPVIDAANVVGVVVDMFQALGVLGYEAFCFGVDRGDDAVDDLSEVLFELLEKGGW